MTDKDPLRSLRPHRSSNSQCFAELQNCNSLSLFWFFFEFFFQYTWGKQSTLTFVWDPQKRDKEVVRPAEENVSWPLNSDVKLHSVLAVVLPRMKLCLLSNQSTSFTLLLPGIQLF